MSTDRIPVVRRLLSPPRLLLLGSYLAIALVQLLQSPGRTTFDTKLDLLVDPGRFLSQSRSLWSSQLGMGELQNQAYGYLFPLGPVFWLGHALASPAWLTERLWSTALMIAAFEGARRLALAWGGLGWGSAMLVGAAFVTAPRFLSTVGTLTGELLPTAVLPWVVLPLVLARRGRIGPYAGPLLSGAAILLMGGQNAVETAATLPLPAVVLIHAVLRAELPWRSIGVWVGAVLAACSWWLGPLLLFGKYSPPFLDYIESAANTTGQLGWLNAVRGADHWVAYVTVGGRPWWPAGFALATSSWLVVVTAAVAALSLAGLVGRGLPDRVCLTIPLGIGLVCLVAAHGGGAGGLFAGQLRSLLDGPLAPLRNVHKVDPLVRLPLALGFGYLARDARVWLAEWLGRTHWPVVRPATVATAVAGCCAVAVLAVSAQPALAGELRQAPGWSAIPAPWAQAAKALDALPPDSRVLVVPASGFGLQVWGNTIDEPLQPLTTADWASRGQAPLVRGGTVRLLDSVEALLATGRGSTGLAPLLARSGFTDVLVRTDLDPNASDAPDPSLVTTSLTLSPGIRLAQTFGVPAGASLPLTLWTVAAPGAQNPRVSVVPDTSLRVVQGGPEALLPLLDSGLLSTDQPALLAGQNAPDGGPVDLLTDTLQRREQAFGRVNDAVSSIMTATDPFRTVRAAHAYPAFPGQQQTVAYYPGLTSVSATSSGGYVDILGAVHPEQGPYSAVDSDDTTAWVTAPFTNPVGQTLTVKLDQQAAFATIPIELWTGSGEPTVTALTVTTDNGSVTVPVPPGSDKVTVVPPAGPTGTVAVTVAGVDARRGTQQVGLADVGLPGVDASRTLVVPGVAGPKTSMLFTSVAPVRACTYPQRVCALENARPAEEEAALDRSFTVAGGGRWTLQVGAVARSSPATSQLLAPVAPGYTIAGSSILGGDPVVAPTFALDGNPLTSWVTDPGDATPTLSLAWPKDRTLRRIQLGLGTQSNVRLPTSVLIRSGGQRRTVPLSSGFFGFFKPLRTNHVTLAFSSGRGQPGAEEPMEIAEVVIQGLQGITYSPSPTSVTGQPCGFGPPVFVDGTRHATKVTGTLGEVLDGSPLSVSLCGHPDLDLAAGSHRVRIASTAQFQPVQAELRPVGDTAAPPAPNRSVRVTSWADSSRRFDVGAGPAAVVWVPQNANAGWVATADGRALEPVVLDGWAQGWRLPAGGPVTVTMQFTPQGSYRAVLLVGGVLALLLVVVTVLAVVRRPARRAARRAGQPAFSSAAGRAAGFVALAAAAVVAGVGVLVGSLLALLPWTRPVWVRRTIVLGAIGLAACWQVAARDDATEAGLLVSLAVGLVIGPDFSGRGDREQRVHREQPEPPDQQRRALS